MAKSDYDEDEEEEGGIAHPYRTPVLITVVVMTVLFGLVYKLFLHKKCPAAQKCAAQKPCPTPTPVVGPTPAPCPVASPCPTPAPCAACPACPPPCTPCAAPTTSGSAFEDDCASWTWNGDSAEWTCADGDASCGTKGVPCSLTAGNPDSCSNCCSSEYVVSEPDQGPVSARCD